MVTVGSCFIIFGYGVALDDPKSARILKYDFDNIGEGPYHFSFETSDGISRQEVGEIANAETEHEFVKVLGSFSYLGPDGVRYEVRYTADDQGFHPEGDHIKVPPFVPWIHHHHHNVNDNNDDHHDHNDHHDHRDRYKHPHHDGPRKIIGSSKKTVVPNLDISGTSPKPVTEFSRLPTPIAPHLHYGEERTPKTLNRDSFYRFIPNAVGEYSSSDSPKAMTPQTINEDYVRNVFPTTPKPPQPNLIFHSTPGTIAKRPLSPAPISPRTIVDNQVIDTFPSTPEPYPILHSTPIGVSEYYPSSSPSSDLQQNDGSTPKPPNQEFISSSTPKAHIPVGYFLPRPVSPPLPETDESRAYIPPVTSPKPFV
uniref:Cuticular protein 8 n=1 Tax=Leptinotarsa decemlineata TaxID=7539 RepID=A0A3Q8HGG2_LEPDE|nr:cuticular protein 8 [Leptinotarsa decemlineata]